jgi:4-hydroxybenzoate polyprenyltransferase
MSRAPGVAYVDLPPLCVDLDGTLIKTDVLVESLVRACRTWRTLCRLPRLFVSGRAGLKHGLATISPPNCDALPYDHELIAYLREQKSLGRELVLVTASNKNVAAAVNEHLGGLFDDLIGSDERRNVRGSVKARILVERFGDRGFAYVGNDRSDLPVWRCAESAVVVGAAPAVVRKASRWTRIDRIFSRRSSVARAALREMRPHQWAKNLLVFVPIFTSGDFLRADTWLGALGTFAAFCAVASSAYIVNDLFDLESDRKHPSKFARPLAAGALPLAAGVGLVPILAVAGIALAALVGVLPYVLGYAAMSLAYSVRLKEMPLIDVFLLTALYSIRLFAGGIATSYEVSYWLLAFSCFLFLGLAIMKRIAELYALRQGGRPPEVRRMPRRAYSTSDIPILVAFGASASFVSSAVLALYVQSDTAAAKITHQHVLWWIVPLMLFWQCRLWLAAWRGQMGDDPIVFAAKDWVSALVALCLVATMVLSHTLK